MQRVECQGGCVHYALSRCVITASVVRSAFQLWSAAAPQTASATGAVMAAWRRGPIIRALPCKHLTAVCTTSRRPCSTPASPTSVVAAAGDHHATQFVRLATPLLLTHEGLAYAACPVCGASFHMLDMQPHLTMVHKHHVSAAHAARICRDRIRLYEHVIGVPLRRAWAGQKDQVGSAALTAVLPTVTADGYVCNWCVERRLVHPTRDAFIKHVLQDHPEVDLDEVEPKIPLLPTAPRHTDHVADGTATGIAQRRDAGPTRRLPGVRVTRDDKNYFAALSPHLASNRVTQRLAGAQTSTAFCSREAALSVVSRPPEQREYIFSARCFPCELCGRIFTNEVHLLQHLEHRHNDAASQVVGEGAEVSGGPAISTTAAAVAHGAHERPGTCAVGEGQHTPSTDPKSPQPSFVCSHCHRSFASQGALDDHTISKHSTSSEKARDTQRDGGCSSGPAITFPAMTEKTKWWCHECERGFAKAKALYAHMVQKHRLPLQLYPCPACKRTFSDVYSLEDHLQMVHRSIEIQDLGITTHVSCPDCRRCFLNHEEWRLHAIKHHKRDPRLPARSLDDTAATNACAAQQSVALPDARDRGTATSVPGVSKTPRKVARRRARAMGDQFTA